MDTLGQSLLMDGVLDGGTAAWWRPASLRLLLFDLCVGSCT
jgi:hypothetical protein